LPAVIREQEILVRAHVTVWLPSRHNGVHHSAQCSAIDYIRLYPESNDVAGELICDDQQPMDSECDGLTSHPFLARVMKKGCQRGVLEKRPVRYIIWARSLFKREERNSSV